MNCACASTHNEWILLWRSYDCCVFLNIIHRQQEEIVCNLQMGLASLLMKLRRTALAIMCTDLQQQGASYQISTCTNERGWGFEMTLRKWYMKKLGTARDRREELHLFWLKNKFALCSANIGWTCLVSNRCLFKYFLWVVHFYNYLKNMSLLQDPMAGLAPSQTAVMSWLDDLKEFYWTVVVENFFASVLMRSRF